MKYTDSLSPECAPSSQMTNFLSVMKTHAHEIKNQIERNMFFASRFKATFPPDTKESEGKPAKAAPNGYSEQFQYLNDLMQGLVEDMYKVNSQWEELVG